jgi:hypothetical protein
VLEGIEKEPLLIDDLIEEVNQNKALYSNIPNTGTLLNLKEYQKISKDFKLIDDASRQLPANTRIDLTKAGAATRKALSDMFKTGKIQDIETFMLGSKDLDLAGSQKSLTFQELINFHSALKGTISDNALNGLRRTSQDMQPIVNLEKKVRNKLNTFLSDNHPGKFAIKKEADNQWIRDTNIIEDGLDKIAARRMKPEDAFFNAMEGSQKGDTTLLNIKRAVNKVNKRLWPEFSASVMNRLGKSDTNSIGFDMNTWYRNYSKLSPEAVGTLFGDVPGLKKKLNDFHNIIALYKESSKDLNTSKTALTMQYLPGYMTKLLTSARGAFGAGATYLTGRLLNNKDFLDFLIDGLDPKKIKRIVNKEGEVVTRYLKKFKPSTHILRLGVIARNNEDIREDIKNFIQGLDISDRDENLKRIFNNTK